MDLVAALQAQAVTRQGQVRLCVRLQGHDRGSRA
jgi:hypothetical protein